MKFKTGDYVISQAYQKGVPLFFDMNTNLLTTKEGTNKITNLFVEEAPSAEEPDLSCYTWPEQFPKIF